MLYSSFVVITVPGNLSYIRLQIKYHENCKFEAKAFTQNLICIFVRLSVSVIQGNGT